MMFSGWELFWACVVVSMSSHITTRVIWGKWAADKHHNELATALDQVRTDSRNAKKHAVKNAEIACEARTASLRAENENLKESLASAQRLSEGRRDALVGIRGMLDHADLDTSTDAHIRRSLYENPVVKNGEPIRGAKSPIAATTINKVY